MNKTVRIESLGYPCDDKDCLTHPTLNYVELPGNDPDGSDIIGVAYCPSCGALYLSLGGPPRRIFNANDYPY